MKMQQVSLGAVGLGVLLVVVAWLWPLVVPGRVLWDDQRAADFAAASVELHEAIHGGEDGHHHDSGFHHRHDHDHSDDHREDIEKAQARYAAARASLERAHALQDGLPRYLQWIGVILGGLGAAGYFFGQRE